MAAVASLAGQIAVYTRPFRTYRRLTRIAPRDDRRRLARRREDHPLIENVNLLSTTNIAAMIFVIAGLFVSFWGRNYLRFLTMRYLSRRVMSYLAMLVIAFFVSLLVWVPAIMNGFAHEFRSKVRGTLSDLMVWGPTPFSFPAPSSYVDITDKDKRLAFQESLLKEIYQGFENTPGVGAIAPYVENPALYKHVKTIDYCFVRGVSPIREEKVSKFRSYIMSPRSIMKVLLEQDLRSASAADKVGLLKHIASFPETPNYDLIYKRLLEPDPDKKLPGVLVGIFFLRAYDLAVGDTIELTTASDAQAVSENKKFVIAGVMQTGFYEQDRRKIYMSLGSAQDFIDIEGRISGISVKASTDPKDIKLLWEELHRIEKLRQTKLRVDPGDDARALRALFGDYLSQLMYENKFPRDSLARTWEEKDHNLLQAVMMEKLLIRLIMSAAVVGAMISIFVVLLMSVREKTRDIGILKSFGGTTWSVFRIFVGQGLVMSLIGVAIGVSFGLCVSLYVNEIADVIHTLTGWHPFPPEVYYLESIPVLVDGGELVQIIGGTAVFSVLLSFVPALKASSLDPIDAIRFQ